MFQQRLGLCALGNICLGCLPSGHFSSNSMTVGGHPLIESRLVFSSFMKTDWNKMFKALSFSLSSSFFFSLSPTVFQFHASKGCNWVHYCVRNQQQTAMHFASFGQLLFLSDSWLAQHTIIIKSKPRCF